ncbi:transporter substrate-binding domain-containing protein [Actinomadura fulvescens]|uniref:ABC transporter substrate-binding protein n=1 Tax=Actinomadura fulvescens TaxID=46160 RepID=A0ABN3PY35_9ACTN
MITGSLRRGVVATAALALTGLLALSACGDDDGGGSKAQPKVPGVKLVKNGQLTVCTNIPYEPFQFNQGGKVVGFDVDLMDQVAKKLGVTQKIIDIDFDAIKSGTALNAGRCDVAAAGMTITPERKANLDFSIPYFDEVLGIMAKKGSGVKTLDDVKAKNLRLAVQKGTTSLDYAKGKGFDPKVGNNSGLQLQIMQSNQADVALQDLPVIDGWLRKGDIASKYELVGQVQTGAQYGFAVKKGGAPELLKTIDETLKASFTDGSWKASFVKWMKAEPASTPKQPS